MTSRLVILLLFALPNEVLSCSCGWMPYQECIEWADEIFMGRVIAINEVNSQETDGHISTGIWSCTFEVTKKWKGSPSKQVTLYQPNTSCDAFFSLPDYNYLVYAKHQDLFPWDENRLRIELTTDLCKRTAPRSTYDNFMGDGQDDRPLLDKSFPNGVDISTYHWKWPILVCVCIAAILLSVRTWRRMGRKNNAALT
jgi:hypothetical protein